MERQLQFSFPQSRPILVNEDSFESSRRDIHNNRHSSDLRTENHENSVKSVYYHVKSSNVAEQFLFLLLSRFHDRVCNSIQIFCYDEEKSLSNRWL